MHTNSSNAWFRRNFFSIGIVLSIGLLTYFYIMSFTSVQDRKKILEYFAYSDTENTVYMPLPLKNRVKATQTWKTDETGIEVDYYRIFQTPNVSQNDPAILSYLRYFHLTPPPYPKKLILPSKNHNHDLSTAILSIFKNKINGFFIEAGANDGEFLSNTLQLERRLKWTGLLIEPNSFMLVKLRLMGRNAWIADVGLALNGYPEKVRFMHPLSKESWGQGIGIIEHNKNNLPPPQTDRKPKNYVYAGNVECFPLFSLLSAINTTTVDYLSLDVEGIEFRVLKAIPFEKLIIKVISLEWYIVPEGLNPLRDFLETKGYQQILVTETELIVAHKDYRDEINLEIDTRGLALLRENEPTDQN